MSGAQVLMKALTGQSGSGDGLLERRVAREVIPLIRQQSYARQLFRVVDMPGRQYSIPKINLGRGVYGVQEGTTAPFYFSVVGQVTLEAKKLMTQLPISAELDEDSVIPVIPMLKEDMAMAFAVAEEDGFLNGDMTQTYNYPPDWPDPTLRNLPNPNDPRALFTGIRALAAGTPVDANGGPISLDLMSRALSNLGVYGKIKGDLVWIISLRDEAVIRALQGFLTIQSYAIGAQSTLIVGEIGRLYGIPVIPTTLMPQNLSGVVNGQPVNNLSEAVLCHRRSVVLGDRRKFMIRTSAEVLIASDQLLVVPSERVAISPQYADAIVKIVRIGASA